MVMSGSLSLALNSLDGCTLIHSHLTKGDMFGEQGLFAEPHACDTSTMVIARTASEIASVSHKQFLAMVSDHPDLLVSFYKRLNRRLESATSKLASFAFLDIEGRIQRELIELATHSDAITHPDGMQVRVSRQDLAKMVNCSREMAGRILKRLSSQGMVQVSGHSIVVHGTR